MDNLMRRTSGSRGDLKPFVKGLTSALLVAILMVVIFALILTAKDLSDTTVRVLNCIALAVASWVGGLVSSKSTGVKGLKVGATIGGIVFALLTVIGVILHGLNWNMISLVKGIICVFCGMAGGVMGVNVSAKRKMR